MQLEVLPFFNANTGELLPVEVLEDGQNELDPLLVPGETLVLKVFFELTHVVGPDAEDVQGLQQVDTVRPSHAFKLACYA